MNIAEKAADQGYEKLNAAIMKALSSSSEVKQILSDFQEKNLIDEIAAVNLVLSLEELEGLVLDGDELEPERKIHRTPTPRRP